MILSMPRYSKFAATAAILVALLEGCFGFISHSAAFLPEQKLINHIPLQLAVSAADPKVDAVALDGLSRQITRSEAQYFNYDLPSFSDMPQTDRTNLVSGLIVSITTKSDKSVGGDNFSPLLSDTLSAAGSIGYRDRHIEVSQYISSFEVSALWLADTKETFTSDSFRYENLLFSLIGTFMNRGLRLHQLCVSTGLISSIAEKYPDQENAYDTIETFFQQRGFTPESSENSNNEYRTANGDIIQSFILEKLQAEGLGGGADQEEEEAKLFSDGSNSGVEVWIQLANLCNILGRIYHSQWALGEGGDRGRGLLSLELMKWYTKAVELYTKAAEAGTNGGPHRQTTPYTTATATAAATASVGLGCVFRNFGAYYQGLGDSGDQLSFASYQNAIAHLAGGGAGMDGSSTSTSTSASAIAIARASTDSDSDGDSGSDGDRDSDSGGGGGSGDQGEGEEATGAAGAGAEVASSSSSSLSSSLSLSLDADEEAYTYYRLGGLYEQMSSDRKWAEGAIGHCSKCYERAVDLHRCAYTLQSALGRHALVKQQQQQQQQQQQHGIDGGSDSNSDSIDGGGGLGDGGGGGDSYSKAVEEVVSFFAKCGNKDNNNDKEDPAIAADSLFEAGAGGGVGGGGVGGGGSRAFDTAYLTLGGLLSSVDIDTGMVKTSPSSSPPPSSPSSSSFTSIPTVTGGRYAGATDLDLLSSLGRVYTLQVGLSGRYPYDAVHAYDGAIDIANQALAIAQAQAQSQIDGRVKEGMGVGVGVGVGALSSNIVHNLWFNRAKALIDTAGVLNAQQQQHEGKEVSEESWDGGEGGDGTNVYANSLLLSARASLVKALSYHQDNSAAKHMLHALPQPTTDHDSTTSTTSTTITTTSTSGPTTSDSMATAPYAKASIEYILDLYRSYSSTYDDSYRKQLLYTGPRILREEVRHYYTTAAAQGFDPPLPVNPRLNIPAMMERGLSVVDLGCGTGLAGSWFRDYAKRLVGVEVSPEMAEKSKDKGIYDRIYIADVDDRAWANDLVQKQVVEQRQIASLSSGSVFGDLEEGDGVDRCGGAKLEAEMIITSSSASKAGTDAPASAARAVVASSAGVGADIVIGGGITFHLGDLQPLFDNVAQVLAAKTNDRPGGVFALIADDILLPKGARKSESKSESRGVADDSYRLNTDGTFEHARGYIEKVADSAGLELYRYKRYSSRVKRGKPTPGHLFLFTLK